ncbi:hypothetical protein R1sor_021607 [Riccia sorocarpa]|uniref:DUF676 domain-containing protein n=1 Tax=Riccia sorocarpa TaxID=122646 RepID=A0ABD3GIZ8_9MARC
MRRPVTCYPSLLARDERIRRKAERDWSRAFERLTHSADERHRSGLQAKGNEAKKSTSSITENLHCNGGTRVRAIMSTEQWSRPTRATSNDGGMMVERKSDRWRAWCECCRVSNEEGKVEQRDERSVDRLENAGEKNGSGNLVGVGVMNGDLDPPAEHLVIMVNGIIGSADDWKFAEEQFRKRLGKSVLIHRSARNSAKATFDGVDTMGKRLAEEVQQVIGDAKGLKKISFVSHSLGGLISRYAISLLYQPSAPEEGRSNATIEGLEPVNFITVATPHAGSRGSQNLPFLLGVKFLEGSAPYLAHLIIGQTGKDLFLTDGNPKKNIPPLLRRMVTDCDEGLFLSSLKAFQRRTAYANVIYDRCVGWATSSVRRRDELPEIRHEPLDARYPHIVRDEEWKGKVSVSASTGAAAAAPDSYADAMEEEIVAGLNQLSWRKVDVSFKGVGWFKAFNVHSIIQVKTTKQMEGKDVIDHIIDKHFLLENSDDFHQISDSTKVLDSVGIQQ